MLPLSKPAPRADLGMDTDGVIDGKYGRTGVAFTTGPAPCPAWRTQKGCSIGTWYLPNIFWIIQEIMKFDHQEIDTDSMYIY